MYKNLLTEKADKILTVTINRESKLNALNLDTIQELKKVFTDAQTDKDVGVIILTGVGLKSFVAGADISEFADFNVDEGTQMAQNGHDVFNLIEKSAKPVIAAVNGFALGGGCELAMACHIRIASENAKFGQPEVNLGIIPGYGGTQRLVQLAGKGKALELIMTGDPISANEAHSLGLVNRVVSQDELLTICKTMATKILTKSPVAISAVISCVNEHFASEKSGFEKEISLFGASFGTGDFKEGTQAFLGKRKAEFKGN